MIRNHRHNRENEYIVTQLRKLNLKVNSENIETIKELRKTKQIPISYAHLLNYLDSTELLKNLMKKNKIYSIIHAEGPTVWDHVKLSIEKLKEMNIPHDVREELSILMLHHDLGKVKVWNNEENLKRTESKLKKGILHWAMIGHSGENLNIIKERLIKNGIADKKLEIFILFIRYHMNTDLVKKKAYKLISLLEKYEKDEKSLKELLYFFNFMIRLDGRATKHVKFSKGKLEFLDNKKKSNFDIINIYEEKKKSQNTVKMESR